MILEFEENGSQRDGGAALQGRGCGIRGFVGQLVGKEEVYVRDGLHLSGKGLPFLPRDGQGRLPVAWVKYDI